MNCSNLLMSPSSCKQEACCCNHSNIECNTTTSFVQEEKEMDQSTCLKKNKSEECISLNHMSRGQLLQRQKLENRELQLKTRALAKTAKKQKNKRNEIESLIFKMQHELQIQHQKELDQMDQLDGAGEEEESSVIEKDIIQKEDEPLSTVPSKVLKALRKREKKKARETLNKEKKESMNDDQGKSDRQVELDAIERLLHSEGFQVKEIPSDGNCMYHALAHQLQRCQRGINLENPHLALRTITANFMREHPDEFIPFLDLQMEEDHSKGTNLSLNDLFLLYCDRVQSTCEWGTQIELMAISKALQSAIWIYFADAPLVKMGEEYQTEPLRLTYHRQYFALGDHYNSVEELKPIESEEELQG